MAQTVAEIMTQAPVMLPLGATVGDAARAMRDSDIGDVLVVDEDEMLRGLVTDRDIVVRALAEGFGTDTPVSEVFTRDPVCLHPQDDLDSAVRTMADYAIRRIPVVEEGKAVGVVAIGDLARERDPRSVLAGISGASPSH